MVDQPWHPEASFVQAEERDRVRGLIRSFRTLCIKESKVQSCGDLMRGNGCLAYGPVSVVLYRYWYFQTTNIVSLSTTVIESTHLCTHHSPPRLRQPSESLFNKCRPVRRCTSRSLWTRIHPPVHISGFIFQYLHHIPSGHAIVLATAKHRDCDFFRFDLRVSLSVTFSHSTSRAPLRKSLTHSSTDSSTIFIFSGWSIQSGVLMTPGATPVHSISGILQLYDRRLR